MGVSVGHNAVEMLMQRAGLKGLPGNRRRRPTHQTPTATDLVDRQFRRDRPNELWVTDITEHPTREGEVYCAVVLDTFSRWTLDDLLAVQDALNSRPRKVLGWKTPAEALDEQLRSLHDAGVATTG